RMIASAPAGISASLAGLPFTVMVAVGETASVRAFGCVLRVSLAVAGFTDPTGARKVTSTAKAVAVVTPNNSKARRLRRDRIGSHSLQCPDLRPAREHHPAAPETGRSGWRSPYTQRNSSSIP